MGGRKNRQKPLTLGECVSGAGKTEKPAYELQSHPSARNETGTALAVGHLVSTPLHYRLPCLNGLTFRAIGLMMPLGLVGFELRYYSSRLERKV